MPRLDVMNLQVEMSLDTSRLPCVDLPAACKADIEFTKCQYRHVK
jgi:hypothetical protein